MMELVVALYARVSSDRQAVEGTIASQVAALHARIAADGLVVRPDHEFLDEGHSGALLLRPALERLRDAAATGQLDRLYVHSPDRLARKYAYQVLLLEELEQAGVEVVFLNRELGRSPEDDLLLQLQGMMAEYERAKISERSRRGRRYQASQGAVSVLAAAPYGYRYVPKAEGGGTARYEIVLEEARVVRQLFTWVGQERLTLGQVQRRLAADGVPSPTGLPTWTGGGLRQILANPAYGGQAAYGKSRNVPYVPPLRQYQGHPVQPRTPVSQCSVPPEDWILIPVPALVHPDLMAAVAEQLAENRRRAREHAAGPSALLQGLICCARCGYAYLSQSRTKRCRDGIHRYRAYRCSRTDAHRCGGTRLCDNRAISQDLADALVWQEVRTLLEEPDRLRAEYERRLHTAEPGAQETERHRLELQRRRLQHGRERLLDSYAEGLLDPADVTPRLARLKERLAELDAQVAQLQDTAEQDRELHLVLGQLDHFAAQITDNLATADDEVKRTIVRALVKRIEVDHDDIHLVFRIPSGPPDAGPNQHGVHHWRQRRSAVLPYRPLRDAAYPHTSSSLADSAPCASYPVATSAPPVNGFGDVAGLHPPTASSLPAGPPQLEHTVRYTRPPRARAAGGGIVR